MAIDVDKSIATKMLNTSFLRCSKTPVNTCPIKNTIDFVMAGKNCLTYRYIMFTALVAKAVNPAVDKNIFRSVENVNLQTIISYHRGDEYHHFLDDYDEGRSIRGTKAEETNESDLS